MGLAAALGPPLLRYYLDVPAVPLPLVPPAPPEGIAPAPLPEEVAPLVPLVPLVPLAPPAPPDRLHPPSISISATAESATRTDVEDVFMVHPFL